jgi:hypothetical protein
MALAAILVLFIGSAMLFVTRPGIEVDEAVVTNPPSYVFHSIPIMNMSYVGALKSWFYYGLFSFVKPGAISLRAPTVLMGALSVWFFFLFLDRTIGRRAAWIGALLLATDSMFILLEAIDFGPNAVHFVFKLGALVLLVRFHQTGSWRSLAGGFFLIGLGLWDKAIFSWSVIGAGIAALAVFPKEVWRHVTIKNLSIGAAFTILGALPLVIYNIDHPLETLRSNVHKTKEPVALKAEVAEGTMNASILFGFITSAEPAPKLGEATNWGLRLSKGTSELLRHPTRNFILAAFCVSLLGVFLPAARKPVLFGLLASIGTWIPMALTAGTGGAAHHAILIWPFHLMMIAAVIAAIPWQGVVIAITAVLCAANLAVTNEYYWRLVRDGPDIRWTDAINPLKRRLGGVRSSRIYIIDWGIVETLNLLSEGSIPAEEPDWSVSDNLRRMVTDPDAAFVAHTAGHAYFPQRRIMLEEAAINEGYEVVPLDTIYDRNGRARFDIFRFRKIPL